MTLRTNARVAGFVLLLYIATAIISMIMLPVTSGAVETATKLADIAKHVSLVRVDILLTLLQAAFALVLAATFYALTRHVDQEPAMIALCCRVTEGVIIVISTLKSFALLSVATDGVDTVASNTIAGLFLKTEGWIMLSSGTCFALGSTIYCYLFLRGRSIPRPLAWLGVVASALLLVVVPLQLAGFIDPSVSSIWISMLLFEVVLAVWLLVKGVAIPLKN
ncbi:MAG TPA: DUF4386 domain-containing protein [Ferruginibacter sp.]|nr:DUF4386 domain-containing protein [Ferruginibacter sp.]